jgi:hypothetical protein
LDLYKWWLLVLGGRKWAKAPGVNFEFGTLPKRTNSPRVKFVFGPLKHKKPSGPLKRGKAPEYHFSLGDSPKEKISSKSKFCVWAHNNGGFWVWWAPKMG